MKKEIKRNNDKVLYIVKPGLSFKVSITARPENMPGQHFIEGVLYEKIPESPCFRSRFEKIIQKKTERR